MGGGFQRNAKRLNFWKLRNLFLKGKVLVINSLFLSKMWYVLGCELPLWVYKKIKSIVLNFLWEGKPSKLLMTLNRKGGGRRVRTIRSIHKNEKYKNQNCE